MAMKQLNTQVFDPSNLDEFSLELSMLARLSSHPGVVRFLGITKRTGYEDAIDDDDDDDDGCALVDVEDGPQLYLVLQWCPRGHLGDMIATGIFRNNERELRRIAREVCAAMAHIHTLSVSHRDLKPQNILISASGSAQICDFGQSQRWNSTAAAATGRITSLCRPRSTAGTSSEGTLLSKLVGTAAFVPPEAILGAARGIRPYTCFEEASKADVYAFGIVLAAMTIHPDDDGVSACRIYADVDKFDDAFLKSVASGHRRPKLNDDAPAVVRTWAPQCWAQDSTTRPTFVDLAETFADRSMASCEATKRSSVTLFESMAVCPSEENEGGVSTPTVRIGARLPSDMEQTTIPL